LQLEELWSANDTKTQQSTLQLTVFVAALMGEGVDGIGAKARWLNWLCGFRVRRSAGGGRKPHGEGGDWDGGRFFFLRALSPYLELHTPMCNSRKSVGGLSKKFITQQLLGFK
jgi:hypothetical protein